MQKIRTIVFATAVLAALALSNVVPADAGTNSPAYNGTPDVNVTAAFYSAGGGPGDFSMVRAMGSMMGAGAFQAELDRLAGTYGADNSDAFPAMFDYAVNDAWELAGRANLLIPPFGSHDGHMLALDLLRDGTAPDGRFWTSYLFDHLLTPKVRGQVMRDLASRYGTDRAAAFDRMSNAFFYDMSQAVGANVSLAPIH